MKNFSYISNSHPAYIESLYKDYVKDPESIDSDLRKFFDGFDYALQSGVNGEVTSAAPIAEGQLPKEFAVYQLIEGYRQKGHLLSTTNPLKPRLDRSPKLALADYGLSENDLNTSFQAGLFIGLQNATLKEIVDRLKTIYCGNVGVEFDHITNPDEKIWVRDAIEKEAGEKLQLDQQKRILEKLNQAVIFERFLQTKYIGQKRFSLEGGESVIPALDVIISDAAADGVDEVVIGMAHRGRLNVLANIMGKTYEDIFNEFEGAVPADGAQGSGDVKYHLGFRSEMTCLNGKVVNLQLCANPSHLEVVDPVVGGFTRAKAKSLYHDDYSKILPILIHGDAAQSGQGIIYEVAQMSELQGYQVGGTVHITINNQIGFTTDFTDGRSSDYCTAIAYVTKSPILHVNGDDIEAVYKVAKIASAYRKKFHKDIYVDVVCYRRHGHNEGDEPKFTQPSLYALIKNHPDPREVYVDYLKKSGNATLTALAEEMEKKFWNDLQERLDNIRQHPIPYHLQGPEEDWAKLRFSKPEDFEKSPYTAISESEVHELTEKLFEWPEDFHPMRKIQKLLLDKKEVFEKENKIDWGTAELLAYASLVASGHNVRLAGEDVKRGTFSHRHSVLFDENNNKAYNRLSKLGNDTSFEVYNSLLSEYGALGFEYGYSIANPNDLTIWEAQYGDFANGAQMVIDQYIVSGEAKWSTMSGLVLLLPHGYEGSGPDHSNARPERFLQAAAEDNIYVTNITTAANFFHALRRQVALPYRKPLINMSPKANLRHPDSYSDIKEFTTGGFKEVIDDPFIEDKNLVKTVLLCSGKLYFDLAERQKQENRKDVALVRLEQFYPIPEAQLIELHKKYGSAVWFWVQEEPLNMGAATFLQVNFKAFPFGVIGRTASASTATGYAKVYKQEQAEIIDAAFNI